MNIKYEVIGKNIYIMVTTRDKIYGLEKIPMWLQDLMMLSNNKISVKSLLSDELLNIDITKGGLRGINHNYNMKPNDVLIYNKLDGSFFAYSGEYLEYITLNVVDTAKDKYYAIDDIRNMVPFNFKNNITNNKEIIMDEIIEAIVSKHDIKIEGEPNGEANASIVFKHQNMVKEVQFKNFINGKEAITNQNVEFTASCTRINDKSITIGFNLSCGMYFISES